VEQLIDDFDALLPGFKKGKGIEKNQSLEVSLQYSLSRLDDDTRALLPRLSVFRGGAFEDDLQEITQIDAATWQSVRAQLVSWSLIRVEHLEGINYPFLRFHPTLAPYLAKQIKDDSKDQLEARYWQRYYSLANFLYNTDTTNPHQARAIARLEMPNLRRALTLAVQAGAMEEAADFATSINRFLNYFGRLRESDDVNEMMSKAMKELKPKKEGITEGQYMMEDGRIDELLSKGQGGLAEQAARGLLERLETADFDASYGRLITMAKIGRSLEVQGKNKAASDQFIAATDYARTLEQKKNVKESIGNLHLDLADTLTELGQYDQARENYEKGKEIFQSQKNYRSTAVALGQLGFLAYYQNNLPEAILRYNEALIIFQGLGEAASEAVAWHMLGALARRAKNWDEADRCLHESLRIEERLENLGGQASACGMLGLVAIDTGRLEDAEGWLKRTLELCKKTGSIGEISKIYYNLADLFLNQNRLDEAEDYAHQARKIDETLDLSAHPWKTFGILAKISERRGKKDEAMEWRRKEQEVYAAFAGSDQTVEKLKQIIEAVVAAGQGSQQAASELEEVLQVMGQQNDWRNLASVIRRILAGERGETMCVGLDGTDAIIVRQILDRLSGQDQAAFGTSSAESEDSPDGLSLDQLLSMVELAAQGNSELKDQLMPAMDQLAQSEDAPVELQALAGVLGDILKGDFNPNLDQLPEELAALVRGMISRLKK